MDFAQTGALTTADLFRNIPAANVTPATSATASGARIERGAKVNLRGLDTGDAAARLMMVDGMRFPPQGNGLCAIDPSIIPAISLDRIDILVDGASATYGSDAIGGVINIILKRDYDGAHDPAALHRPRRRRQPLSASQLWGRTWDGGEITLTYEWYNEPPIKGNALLQFRRRTTRPGALTTERRSVRRLRDILTGCRSHTGVDRPASNSARLRLFNSPAHRRSATNCYAIPLGTGANFDPAAAASARRRRSAPRP